MIVPPIFYTLAGSALGLGAPSAHQTLGANAAGTAWALRTPAWLDRANTFTDNQTITGAATGDALTVNTTVAGGGMVINRSSGNNVGLTLKESGSAKFFIGVNGGVFAFYNHATASNGMTISAANAIGFPGYVSMNGAGQVAGGAFALLATSFLLMYDRSAPATVAGAGSLYVESGALKFKGGSGTVTTLAPT